MKKSILNLGKNLNKTQQKNINGGMNSSDNCSGPWFLCAVDSCDVEGSRCAFQSNTGGLVIGTVQNGVCCS